MIIKTQGSDAWEPGDGVGLTLAFPLSAASHLVGESCDGRRCWLCVTEGANYAVSTYLPAVHACFLNWVPNRLSACSHQSKSARQLIEAPC
jgi:hypothetical protein